MQIKSSTNIQQQKSKSEANDLLSALGKKSETAAAEGTVADAKASEEFSNVLEAKVSAEEKNLAEQNLAEGKGSKSAEASAKAEGKSEKDVALAQVLAGTTAAEGAEAPQYHSKFLADQHKAAVIEGKAAAPQQAVTGELKPKSIFDINRAPAAATTETSADLKVALAQAQAPMAEEAAPVALEKSDVALAVAAGKQAQAPNKAEASAEAGKLLNLNEFMAKQSQSAQKRMGNQIYAAQSQKSIFAEKLDRQLPASIDSQLNKQDALQAALSNDAAQMDRNLELGAQFFPQEKADSGAAGTNAKPVLDLGTSDLSTDADKIIDQVKNYIIQSKASNNPQMEVSFKHADLGVVDLTVAKADDNQVSILIAANTQEAHKFFSGNQGDLLSSLASAGIKVSDFKLDNNSSDSSSRGFSQQGQQDRSDQQFSDSRRQDSERRRDLWSMFQEREAA